MRLETNLTIYRRIVLSDYLRGLKAKAHLRPMSISLAANNVAAFGPATLEFLIAALTNSDDRIVDGYAGDVFCKNLNA